MRVMWVGAALGLLGSCSPSTPSALDGERPGAPEVSASEVPVSGPSAVEVARRRVAKASAPPTTAWVDVVFTQEDHSFGRRIQGLRVAGNLRCVQWKNNMSRSEHLSMLYIDSVELPWSPDEVSCFPGALESFRTRDVEGKTHRWFRPREFRYKRSEYGGSLKGYCGEDFVSDICPHEQTKVVLEVKVRCEEARFLREVTSHQYSHKTSIEMAWFDFEHRTHTLKIQDVFVVEPDPCPSPGERWVEVEGIVDQEFVTQEGEPSPPPQVPRRLVFDGVMKQVYGDVDPT